MTRHAVPIEERLRRCRICRRSRLLLASAGVHATNWTDGCQEAGNQKDLTSSHAWIANLTHCPAILPCPAPPGDCFRPRWVSPPPHATAALRSKDSRAAAACTRWRQRAS